MSVNLKRFRENLTYQETANIGTVKNDLERIAQIDKAAEKKYPKYDLRFKQSQLLQSLSLLAIMFVLLAAFYELQSGRLVFISILLGSAVVGSWMTKSHWQKFANYYSRLNLAAYRDRYQLLQELVKLWERDMSANAQLKVNLIFDKIDAPKNKVSQKYHPNRPSRKLEFYQSDWLKVKGQFLDETHFFINITEHYQNCTWRNINNKYKKKSKHKGFEIRLKLSYSPERYRSLSALQADAEKAVKLPQTAILKGFQVTPTAMRFQVRVPNESKNLLSQTITLMFLSAYQILNLASILTKQQA